MTVGEFCRREGVSEWSFYRWRKRIQEESGRSCRKGIREESGRSCRKGIQEESGRKGNLFAPVVIVRDRGARPTKEEACLQDGESGVLLVLGNGIGIRLRTGFDEGTLRRAVEIVSGGNRSC
jgi:hypothetical protein